MARFDRLSVYTTMLEDGLVPLFYHPDAQAAGEIAAALSRGGARLLEFTNRGDGAITVFSHLVAAHPRLIIGAGSIEDAPTAALFLAHGANFIVAPTFNEEIAKLCNRRKIPYLPGCGTVNEIATAEMWGAEIVKLFPGSVGGPEFVKAILGPRPWTRLMPTGGVSLDEAGLKAWFDAGVCCVGGGSELVRKAWVSEGDYQALETATREVLKRIRQVRKKGG
ncbi:MAG: bifunctional 4-hydroxy-2-oxoglutarate aldolase/2-dehydro-3-deoxy-phosphogluconate aldolase [Truepera sp.]|nr:bifunctional 4-hydroxy-2-oxoglutarate aldolase/2-dehydro-3-deoxy-phosphogluconate aldolase [Truepera sp.]